MKPVSSPGASILHACILAFVTMSTGCHQDGKQTVGNDGTVSDTIAFNSGAATPDLVSVDAEPPWPLNRNQIVDITLTEDRVPLIVTGRQRIIHPLFPHRSLLRIDQIRESHGRKILRANVGGLVRSGYLPRMPLAKNWRSTLQLIDSHGSSWAPSGYLMMGKSQGVEVVEFGFERDEEVRSGQVPDVEAMSHYYLFFDLPQGSEIIAVAGNGSTLALAPPVRVE